MKLLYSIKNLIENYNSIQGKMFSLFIQSLILISLIGFCFETLPNITESNRQILRIIEVVTVVIFTIEYALRIVVSDNKTTFIFSFFGMVDLLAILPFYLSTGVDLRSIRAFRLFRVIRIFKLARYNKAVKRYSIAFNIIKEELILFLFVSIIVIFLSAIGIYYFENAAQPQKFSSIFDSLWWSIITLTTVGYGDMTPITVGGKIFTFIILIVGLGIVAIPAGLVASSFSKAREMEKIEKNE